MFLDKLVSSCWLLASSQSLLEVSRGHSNVLTSGFVATRSVVSYRGGRLRQATAL
jgi:hypothetical protein